MNIKDYLDYNSVTGDFTWKKTTTNRIKVGDLAGSLNKTSGYIELRFKGKHYYGHRLAWEFVHGIVPKFIDHVNQNRADNSIFNLREVSRLNNNKNCRVSKNNSSGTPGISQLPTGKWRAVITVNYKQKHLGVFTDIVDAIQARTDAKLKYNFHRNHA